MAQPHCHRIDDFQAAHLGLDCDDFQGNSI